MDKLEVKTKTITSNVHSFYCDECGEFLGSTEEYEDGYYHDLGKFYLNYFVPEHGWYEVNKHFCNKCKEKYLKQIIDNFVKLGFVAECD